MFEKVNPGHPDKVADRIGGALVDYAYSQQENPKIAVEVLIGHGLCTIISETSVKIPQGFVESTVQRIAGEDYKVIYNENEQDIHLADNQKNGFRCGDNGIFKGVPVTYEEETLSEIAREIYKKYPTDGKYILSNGQLTICQSNAKTEDLEKLFPNAIINPLGEWTGGAGVDSGCIDENALILTIDGLKRMKDIKVNDIVKTQYDYSRVTEVIDKGVKKAYKLYDKRGHSVICTEEHPFLVINNGKFIYKQCNELIKGDSLVRMHKVETNNDYHLNRTFKNGRGEGLSCTLTSNNIKELWLLGYLIGDGWYNTKDGTIFISMGNDYKTEYITNLIKECFGIDTKVYKSERKKTNGDIGYDIKVCICSKTLCDLLSNLGFKCGALNKQLPDSLLKLSDTNICHIISGMFDSDGHHRMGDSGRNCGLQTESIVYTSSSYQLIQDLQTFLTKIGIQSTINRRYDEENHFNCYGEIIQSNNESYVLNISGEVSKNIFRKRIGFQMNSEIKNDKHIVRKDEREFSFVDNRSYPCYLVKDLINKDLYLKYRYGLEKFSDKASVDTERNISYQYLTKVLDLYGKYYETQEYAFAKELLNYDLIEFDRVEDCGERHVYDINVENEEHCFIANGFIVHNCTNRKLGSDMAGSITGGGINAKDMSKADVSVNIYCFVLAQKLHTKIEASCSIGDEDVVLKYHNDDGELKFIRVNFTEIVSFAKKYVETLGGFEKLAEWGLV